MDILRRIDVALLRMKQVGHENTIHYKNLENKRILAAFGKGRVIDVTEETIGAVGGLLARISIAHRMDKFNIDF